MSILLEALKKSERQRRLGETPTLETGGDLQAAPPGWTRHWIPVTLAVIGAGAMAWFGWQQIRPPEPGAAAAISSVPEESAPAPSTGPAADRRQARQPDTAPAAAPPRTPTERFADRSAASGGAEQPASDQAQAEEEARARLSRSVSSYRADTPAEEAAPPERQSEPEPLQPPPPAEEAGVADAGPDAATPMERQIPEPISYWELPQGVRDNLPEFRITVLVYAERPEDRFLLANGQRLAENDELESGLVLEEIRRDGAVFLFRNYRFLVKG